MAIDRALLLSPSSPPTLRFYGWKPWALSLGYFQKESAFDLQKLREQGYEIVRRPTGGSAVFHAEELTFSLTMPGNNPWIPHRVPDSYCAIHKAIQIGLSKLGVDAKFRDEACLAATPRGKGFCFYDPAASDLLVNGKKIVGSAQRRSRGRLLHHGSIVLRSNPITPEISSIENSGGHFDFTAAEKAMIAGFEEKFQIQLVEKEMSVEERALADQLVQEETSRHVGHSSTSTARARSHIESTQSL